MRRRSVVRLSIALVVGLFATGGLDVSAEGGDDESPACILCARSKAVTCPTCAGKGRALVTCDVCDGRGRGVCTRRVEGDAAANRERRAADVSTHTGTERRCPNPYCREGSVAWDDGKTYPCRLCGGRADVPCTFCKDAHTPCAACGGAGKAERPCADCGATGNFVCPLCAKAGTACARCLGAGATPCPRCKGADEVMQPCARCETRGTSVCDDCLGLGKLWCMPCAATGRSRAKYEDSTTAWSMECSNCEGKGRLDCGRCKDGHRKCSLCDGAKRVLFKCPACGKTNKVPCRGCGVWSFRAAELAADVLVARPAAGQDAKDAALRLYERAVALARASAPSVEKAIGPKDRAQLAAAVDRCVNAIAKLRPPPAEAPPK